MGVQIQPCCCSCVTGTYSSFSLSCITTPIDLQADPGRLSECRLVFIGTVDNDCSQVFSIPAPTQTALKAWVEAGGRLYVMGDSVTCFNRDNPTNRTNYNNFLGFLGTGMQLTTNIPDGCPPTDSCYDVVPASIGIMNGLTTPMRYSLGGEISGGTPLASTATDVPVLGCDVPHVFIAAEEIGAGLVVACASSFTLGFCVPAEGNCQFFNRLCDWTIARILA